MRETLNFEISKQPILNDTDILYMSEADVEANSISLEESERRLTALIDNFYAQK